MKGGLSAFVLQKRSHQLQNQCHLKATSEKLAPEYALKALISSADALCPCPVGIRPGALAAGSRADAGYLILHGGQMDWRTTQHVLGKQQLWPPELQDDIHCWEVAAHDCMMQGSAPLTVLRCQVRTLQRGYVSAPDHHCSGTIAGVCSLKHDEE